MKTIDCGVAREALPGAVRGEIAPALGAHLGMCEACRSELELVRWLYETRPAAPADLARRVSAVARDTAGGRRHPAWAVTAAAVAALALGIGLSSGSGTDLVAPAFAQEFAQEWPWIAEDGLVAGAPMFDELSDQDLTVLLADLDVASARP